MAQTHLNRARHRCDTSGIMRSSVQQESGEKRHLPTRRKTAVQLRDPYRKWN